MPFLPQTTLFAGTLPSFGTPISGRTVEPGSVTLQGGDGVGGWTTINADQYGVIEPYGILYRRTVDSAGVAVGWDNTTYPGGFRWSGKIYDNAVETTVSNETFSMSDDGFLLNPVGPDGSVSPTRMVDYAVDGVIFAQGLVLFPTGASGVINTGSKQLTTFSDDATVGTVAWSNPSKAQTSNDDWADALVTGGAVSHYLKGLNIGATAVPANATIVGVQLDIERHAKWNLFTNPVQDNSIKLVKGGVISGTDHAAGANWPSSDAVATFGNSSDLWGLALTPADVNGATFGAVVSCVGIDRAFVDRMGMTIYYTTPSGIAHVLMPLYLGPSGPAATPLQGHVRHDSTLAHYMYFYDSVRDRSMMNVGFAPYAYPIGAGPTNTATVARNLAAVSAGNGGAIAIPIVVTSHMLFARVGVWNTDIANARSAEWRLYEDRLDNSNSLNEIAGANGTWSFTPSAASFRSSPAAVNPTYIAPGLYWLVIRNTSSTQTFGVGEQAAGTLAHNTCQTKSIPALGSTLDFIAATWTKQTSLPGVILEGKVFADSTVF